MQSAHEIYEVESSGFQFQEHIRHNVKLLNRNRRYIFAGSAVDSIIDSPSESPKKKFPLARSVVQLARRRMLIREPGAEKTYAQGDLEIASGSIIAREALKIGFHSMKWPLLRQRDDRGRGSFSHNESLWLYEVLRIMHKSRSAQGSARDSGQRRKTSWQRGSNK